MAAKPRILFLCHSASRNGATVLWLHFLQWLRPKVDWDIEALVEGSGPLLNDFRFEVNSCYSLEAQALKLLAAIQHCLDESRQCSGKGSRP